MTGGLINIAVSGGQDLFLTGNPEISHFKAVYRRHTNFAVESYKLNFDDVVGFGTESHIELPRIGDLVNKIYVEIDVPSMHIPRVPISKQNYDNRVTTAYSNYKDALIDLNTVGDFMSLNMQGYRLAVEDYEASNETSITTMKNSIINSFNISSVGSSSSDINLQIVNNFRDLLAGTTFDITRVNLNYIAENADDNTYGMTEAEIKLKKIEFYNQIISAVQYSYKINKYYRDIVNTKYNTYLDVKNLYYKFAWVKRLGHSIIDYVDIFIGGEKIDRHYGLWLDVWYELTGKKEQDKIYMKMIGNVPDLTTYDRNPKPKYIIHVPLQFWFCRHNGTSLPLVALEYNKVSIAIKFRNIDDVAYIEKTDTTTFQEKQDLRGFAEDNSIVLNSMLVVDYVFLDGPERRKFAQSAHEYLIEQMQYMESNDIKQEIYSARLDFNHPTKEIIWLVQKISRLVNDTGDKELQWWNYGVKDDGSKNPVIGAKLDFNGYERVALETGNYFNYVMPYYHHSNTPADGINLYSFSIYPEEHQPSGSCNFTRIDNSVLTLRIDPAVLLDSSGNEDSIKVWIFGVNYNILRIVGGFGALAFV